MRKAEQCKPKKSQPNEVIRRRYTEGVLEQNKRQRALKRRQFIDKSACEPLLEYGSIRRDKKRKHFNP